MSSRQFVEETVTKNMDEEQKLCQAIPWVPDLQCAWQIFVQCAGSRCHHMLRTLPPSKPQEYAEGQDNGMQRTMDVLLGGLPGWYRSSEPHHKTKKNFQQVYRNNNKRVSWPHCPYVWVSGVRSTRRIAPAACWASWADALHMIQGRRPEVADAITQRFGAHPGARRSCSLPGILLDHNGLVA